MFTITRQIGIDAGHRIPTHGSKCKNIHGHRYTIEATCAADNLITEGTQKAMVLDFGFLKDEMMKEIDEKCDHGFIIWHQDALLDLFLGSGTSANSVKMHVQDSGDATVITSMSLVGKLYVVPFIPTAENLASHWFELLDPQVHERSGGMAVLKSVTVHETPNCFATFEPGVLIKGPIS